MGTFFTSPTLKILITGNNPRWRAQLRHQLDLFGQAEILETADGDEAFDCIRAFQPNAVICSLSMQPYDGIALTLKLRRAENSPHPYVPILMIATRADHHRLLEARDAGVNAVLLSPLSCESLQAHLHEIIENPRPFIRAGNYFGPDRRMHPRADADMVPCH